MSQGGVQSGTFIISLDFEIMWGVCDKPGVRSYYLNNLLGVRQVIPALLDLFASYEIHATFATVGMLFASNRQELMQYVPVVKPLYDNKILSPYHQEINEVGEDESGDPLHYAKSLIQLIRQTPGQEIGCHTFCHYYCLEKGQTLEAFAADLQAAKQIAAANGITVKSLVFPRNQFNAAYLQVMKEQGFTSYRGNEHSWLYRAKNRQDENLLRRLGRLIDSYVNLSGHHLYDMRYLKESTTGLYNIPASRFLRPYNSRLRALDRWRLKRILDDMAAAAKKGAIYHLWWHPHNFGVNLSENLTFLRSILTHFQKLQKTFDFKSLTMSELVAKLEGSTNGGS